MKSKVLVTQEVFDGTLEYLSQHVELVSNQAGVKWNTDELAARLQGVQGLVSSSSDRIDAVLLERCPDLKVVSNIAVGFNNIDVAACTARGVMATNTPGILTDTVADLAICLTLATLRRFVEGEDIVQRGEWKGTHLKQLLGHDLHHATLGLFGFGRIGQAIARRLRGFETKLLYHTRTRAAAEIERELGATYLAKNELLERSDIVLLILPYTPETHHFIGAAEIARMKSSAVLINMARGGIVDDSALAEALKTRRIWAAGLDVYENEPKINPALFGLSNVVLSPHIASATEPTRQAMAMCAAKNCVAALREGNPPNLLNPEVKGNRIVA